MSKGEDPTRALVVALNDLLSWTEALSIVGCEVPLGAWIELNRRQDKARAAIAQAPGERP